MPPSHRLTLGPLDSQLNVLQLGGPSSSSGSVGGAGRVPLSAAKSRLSMGPRQSMAPAARNNLKQPAAATGNANAAVGGLVQDLNSLSLAGASASAGRPSMSGPGRRQSVAPANRRSSVYGRRSSMHAQAMNAASQLVKDPRNVRDKQWQYAAIRALIKFLVEAGYEATVSPKILNSPSAKDFQNMFRFLYGHFAPKYEWDRKRFEEEVPVLLKELKYPFADQINKSQLLSVGSMHGWPALLAALVWMVQLILSVDQVKRVQESVEVVASDPDEVFLQFLNGAYEDFLGGNDDIEGMLNGLSVDFDKRNGWMREEVARLEQEQELLKAEIQKLKTEASPLQKCTEETRAYSEDISKVHRWAESLQAKTTQVSEQLQGLQYDVDVKLNELQHAEKEKLQLHTIVENQEISPADVDRMHAERDQLTKQLDQFTAKEENLKKRVWENEIAFEKKLDQTEKFVQEFNTKARRLELVPTSARFAGGINFELALNGNANRAEQMISADLRGTIQSSLSALRAKLSEACVKAEDKQIALKESLDRTGEHVSEKTDDLGNISSALRQLQEQYETEKETATAELQSKTEEIEMLDRELRRHKVEGTRGLFDAQKAARELTLDYDTAVRQTGERKEKLVKEALIMIEDIAGFQAHVSNQIADLLGDAENMLEELQKQEGEDGSHSQENEGRRVSSMGTRKYRTSSGATTKKATVFVTVHPLKDALLVQMDTLRQTIPVRVPTSTGEVRPFAEQIRAEIQQERGSGGATATLSSIEQALRELMLRRRRTDESFAEDTGMSELWSHSRKLGTVAVASSASAEQVSMDHLSEYLEALYEELPQKVWSIQCLALLARDPATLYQLLSKESLLGTVTRVLNEEGKKSIELCTHAFTLFFCAANHPDLHSVLTSNKVGDACFRAIEREIMRHQLWCEDAKKWQEMNQGGVGGDAVAERHQKLAILMQRQDRILLLAFRVLFSLGDRLAVEIKMVKRGMVDLLAEVLSMLHGSRKTVLSATSSGDVYPELPDGVQQELSICLLDFVQRLSIFQENRGKLRDCAEELLAAMAVLLEQEEEPVVTASVTNALSNLLHDAHFCTHMVTHQPELVSYLTDLVRESDGAVSEAATDCLYLLSCATEARTHLISASETIPVIMRCVLEYEKARVPENVAALLCNLASDPKGAQILCGEDSAKTPGSGMGLRLLVKRALKTRDPLLWKCIRLVVQHPVEPIKLSLLPYVDDVAKLIRQCHDSASASRGDQERIQLLGELLGVFAALTIPGFDFVKLCDVYGILDMLEQMVAQAIPTSPLVPGKSSSSVVGGTVMPLPATAMPDDDLSLASMHLLGTMLSMDPQFPAYLVGAHRDLGPLLERLLGTKSEDTEFLLQVLYALYRCLLDQGAKQQLLAQQPHLIAQLWNVQSGLDSVDSPGNADTARDQAHRLADACLELAAAPDEHGNSSVLSLQELHHQRFVRCHQAWLHAINHDPL